MRRIRSNVASSNHKQMIVKLCKINVVVSIVTDTLSRLFLSVFLYQETCVMRRRLCTKTNPQY